MPGWTGADIAAMTRANPYGTLGPSPAVVMNVNQQMREPPKRKYFTFKKGGAGRDPKDIIKLLAGQKLGFLEGRGYYAAGKATGGGGARGGGSKQLTDQQIIDQYTKMLRTQQQGVLDALLGDAAKRRQGELASLAGFGAALQGYSHDLWGQTNETYRNAAAAQQSMAQGLGGQVGSGIAGARAQQAALAGSLGHTGETNLPTAEAGAAQVASEGGADTGAMMGAVGTAWGGYGATRPEYIGFMTGQNQMQLAREGIEADRDLQSEFLKLGMENPTTAFDMWSKMQENKRQNVSTSLAQQTLRTNIAMQRAKLKQDYLEMRSRAKTAQEKLALDREYKREQLKLDQQGLQIDQQNADTAVTRAETGRINATKPPQSAVPKYAAGDYTKKVSSAMYNVPKLFENSGGKDRANYAFSVLWPQIAPFVSGANKKAARDLLLARIRKAAKAYSPKPSSGSSSGGAPPGVNPGGG
jgi:hypothetical protein